MTNINTEINTNVEKFLRIVNNIVIAICDT